MLTLDKKQVKEAAVILERGGIILYPTDTVYGLGVDATNTDALKKLKELKGREEGKPISVIVSDMAMAGRYALVNEKAKNLAAKFLPGALTLVLKKKEVLPKELAGGETIAIRIPNNEFCLELAKAFGKPYTTTSANVSGMETKSEVSEILEQFGDRAAMIDYVIDVGSLSESKPSTVVEIDNGIKILRKGAIPKEEIFRYIAKD